MGPISRVPPHKAPRALTQPLSHLPGLPTSSLSLEPLCTLNPLRAKSIKKNADLSNTLAASIPRVSQAIHTELRKIFFRQRKQNILAPHCDSAVTWRLLAQSELPVACLRRSYTVLQDASCVQELCALFGQLRHLYRNFVLPRTRVDASMGRVRVVQSTFVTS